MVMEMDEKKSGNSNNSENIGGSNGNANGKHNKQHIRSVWHLTFVFAHMWRQQTPQHKIF